MVLLPEYPIAVEQGTHVVNTVVIVVVPVTVDVMVEGTSLVMVVVPGGGWVAGTVLPPPEPTAVPVPDPVAPDGLIPEPVAGGMVGKIPPVKVPV